VDSIINKTNEKIKEDDAPTSERLGLRICLFRALSLSQSSLPNLISLLLNAVQVFGTRLFK
jgi:hypothetical protein